MVAFLYAVSMVLLLIYGLNLLWMAVRYAATDRLRPGPVPDPEEAPSPGRDAPYVTVQLPLYNEAFVVDRLIEACAHLDYPRHRLEIQVLDDSTDETTALVARQVRYWKSQGLNIIHIHRKERDGYKAGALQNGLLLARGDLLAIFDADFLPKPLFLRHMVPHFNDPAIGMVQARWGHLNADTSLLTAMQAFGLDTHFAVEQHVRHEAGYFINFNGTAGLWRRRCIEDAGGWQGDTLTEDLDLSYRAQLQGWQFRYLSDVEVAAELPVNLNAFRNQQFRWTKGSVQTARKMLVPLWRSHRPFRIKLEGTLHLTAHLVFPVLLLVTLLHAPLLLLKHLGQGPGPLYFATMGLGLLGFVGFFMAQLFAQRALYPDWSRRIRRFPLFMAGSMGMALNNTYAIWQALRGTPSAFVRTPKFDHQVTPSAQPWWKSRYAETHLPPVVWLELLLTLYSIAGLVATLYVQEWTAVPFQSLFVIGFGMITLYNIQQYAQAR